MRQEPLVLGSGSPRRRELLSTLKLDFDVIVADVDETPRDGEDPDALVWRLAVSKLDAVMSKTGAYVLAADTIVVVDDEVLGKPVDDAAGRAMLLRLADRQHYVTTAIALGRGGERLGVSAVTTEVTFAPIADDEAERYVATGEGRDKAGGYAIQGLGGGFVRSIVGSYSNVVGLPVHGTLELLRDHGVVAQWP